MGGCFSSSGKVDTDRTPVYHYCPRTAVGHEPVAFANVASVGAGADTENGRLKGSECKNMVVNEQVDDKPSKLSESDILAINEEEDVCPTCLEEYDLENPRIVTKCEHHFHMSCILEWMERSDTCPVCNKIMMFDAQ